MPYNRTTRYALAIAATVAVAPAAWAGSFGTIGTDTTTSLGQFQIQLAAPVQALFGGQTTITSPVLSDPSTEIARSAPFAAGATGNSPVNVGSSPPATVYPASSLSNTSQYSNLSSVPNGFQTPATCATNCPEQVLTEIQTFNLTGGGMTVAAGAAGQALLANLPNSFGMVQSNTNTTGTSNANDFPANSFFDIFAVVEIPAPGGGNLLLSNYNPNGPPGTPLVVQANGLTAFPPTVVYTHGTSSTPTLYLDGEVGTSAYSSYIGDPVGTIQLAGHGVGYTNTPQSKQQFQQDFIQAEANNGTPLSSQEIWAITMPEPGSLTLCAMGLGGLAWVRRRRSQRK